MAKDTSAFCYPEQIADEMRRLFGELKSDRHLTHRKRREFASGAAHFLAELNVIHPFREGNGRTQLTFLAMLADDAGQPLDLDRLDPDATLDAMIKSFKGDEAPLAHVIETLIA